MPSGRSRSVTTAVGAKSASNASRSWARPAPFTAWARATSCVPSSWSRCAAAVAAGGAEPAGRWGAWPWPWLLASRRRDQRAPPDRLAGGDHRAARIGHGLGLVIGQPPSEIGPTTRWGGGGATKDASVGPAPAPLTTQDPRGVATCSGGVDNFVGRRRGAGPATGAGIPGAGALNGHGAAALGAGAVAGSGGGAAAGAFGALLRRRRLAAGLTQEALAERAGLAAAASGTWSGARPRPSGRRGAAWPRRCPAGGGARRLEAAGAPGARPRRARRGAPPPARPGRPAAQPAALPLTSFVGREAEVRRGAARCWRRPAC